MTVAARPVVAALAVVIRKGAVLLVRRRNPPDAGLWGFPGGKVEFGETVEQAAIRELAEETTVAAVPGRAFAAVDAFDHDEAGILKRQFVLIAVRCRWLSGEPVAGDDAMEAAWFPLSALSDGTLETSLGVAEVAARATAEDAG
ncbi:NUDIX hydrolase [Zavarzinia compransoris]|uniref:NUDIX hydrolase n=1 Tax=Zavarzinia marina TaxID=2911065 RepID=UPI001F1B4DF5|nr:NUDIX hydrolase [Zavarzinia marina]MCF4164897.1 NUDIX hydrolase [Zavarzinia marina]